MVRRFAAGVLLIVTLGTSVAVASDIVEAPAPDWAGAGLGTSAIRRTPQGPVTLDDLLRLRDIGGLSLSPDGAHLAFTVQEADPENDRYETRVFIVATSGGQPRPVRIDAGQPFQNIVYGVAQGALPIEAGKWSQDGRRYAFRRRVDQRYELWVSDLDGHAIRVSSGEPQVAAFAWQANGGLTYRTGLNFARYQAGRVAEAEAGWLFDGRSTPFSGEMGPLVPSCQAEPMDSACEVGDYTVELSGATRPATSGETASLRNIPGTEALGKLRRDGSRLRLVNSDPATYTGFRPVMQVEIEGPSPRRCVADACFGQRITAGGWTGVGDRVWFLKAESGVGRAHGAPYDLTGLYEWDPVLNSLRVVSTGDQFLSGCQVHEGVGYCLRESALRPREIVRIDFPSGRTDAIADPNPHFASKALPRVRKISYSDSTGNPGFALVVYPLNYVEGEDYPLVVTQYRAKGFLRGNVGDEYPILPLSAQGFVVLVMDSANNWDAAKTMTVPEYDAWRMENLRERRLFLGALDQTVDRLVEEGLVDQRRMAITGLSAGAEMVHFALQQSDRWAAGIASSGAHDLSWMALLPEGQPQEWATNWFRSESVTPRPGSLTHQLAWSQRPERLRTPLLINAAEREALFGLEGVAALRFAGRPVEMRVFADEGHIKYHPRNRRAIYELNVAWLKFWLMGAQDYDPSHRGQFARWAAMTPERSPNARVDATPRTGTGAGLRVVAESRLPSPDTK